MKKTVFLILLVGIIQFGYCQEPDTLKVLKDTIPATVADTIKSVEKTVVATPAKEKAAVSANAKKDQRTFKEKFGFGLGASFWFSSSENYFEVSPTVAYRFPKRLTTGVGYRYIYRHDKIYDANVSSYGPLLFARADLIYGAYFWTEYEFLKNKYSSNSHDIENFTSNTDSWFLGLGYTRSVGKKGRGGIGIQVLYNVLYKSDKYSPYYGPLIYRIGYFF